MDINRYVSMEILIEIEENHAYSNLIINQYLEKYKITEGAFIRELVYGVLERKLTLDYYLRSFVTRGFNQIKPPVKALLRMGLYQILYLDSVAPYAAINECVEISKKTSKNHSGFLNGVLRNCLRKKETLVLPAAQKDRLTYLEIKYSYSKPLIQYWLASYPQPFVEALLECGNARPPLTLRVNTLKSTVQEVCTVLEKEGYECLPGKHSKNAIHITKGKHILSHKLFKEGVIQPQDESSMLAVEALEVKKGECVIDVCSGPGGKTAYIGALMENKGTLIGLDVHPHRVKLIETIGKRHGITLLKTACVDATVGESSYTGIADKVLVDAPCSGFGVIRRKPELKYMKDMNHVEDLGNLQYEILKKSFSYLKPGGTLVYSTCTISEKENSQVIQRFLKADTEAVFVEEKQYYPNVDGTDGFYIGKLKKSL